MSKDILSWAIQRAQTITTEIFTYEGTRYLETIKMFSGTLPAGAVRKYRAQYGTNPLSTEMHSISCKWGGNFKSQAGNVVITERKFTILGEAQE